MATKNIFSKHLPNVKLATRFDADGNEIQVERREDEEQKRKEQDIIDTLVGAGYYRAHIQGLSSFDKIVGGMTWCIEACDYDVNVDLLFHENLTIGQKIALTEKIVGVLPRMKCPFLIEPHQIQGLDFINIFPVVQWLVKRSVENRSKKADTLRKLAATQFQNHCTLESDRELQRMRAKQLANLQAIESKYLPKRGFKLRKAAGGGWIPVRPKDVTDQETPDGALEDVLEADVDGEEGDEDVSVSTEQELNFDVLFKNIAKEHKISVELTEADRSTLAKTYDNMKQTLSGEAIEQVSERNRIKAQLALKLALEKKLELALSECEQLKTTVQEEEQQLKEAGSQKEALEEEIRNLDNLEITEANQKILDHVKELVLKNERMKKQETQFKENCKKELAELQQKIDKAETSTPDEDMLELQRQLDMELERLKSLRLQLAKKNRSYVAIKRQLDTVPDRTELAQYQRRFLELYNQVSAKHRETKQFYTLYNTLDDTKLYLEKELSLLNSIYDNYANAMQTPHSREQFVQQFETIVEGIRATKAKLKKKCDDERAKRDGLNGQLVCLMEQQRKYATTVKQLTMECQRNEALMQHLKALKASIQQQEQQS
ncbi:coiled-coil domain-containing protein 93-like isoform X1 [Anopheles merus]|uniref:coiled-coil domain-containing protein 93-like isoform X1 n=1 Tax=Anopheles merus TaxID=30066 RepID=UPI001BE4D35B|nr:coiled-coil domain-containing protein 93-like isoform X1 [Anopheles merus]XP_041777642.1 coiled-coil domain-containing protein 93-like isoform X1 [Anopheles merus]